MIKVGRREHRGEIIREMTKKYGIEDCVVEIGYVSEENMPLLYSGADMFVFPSRFEGFGLPVLEAMATECPVVTSNVTSIPEVVGGAVQMFDPDDTEGMADIVLNCIKHPELRLEMGQKGRVRAELFGWDKSAEETMKIYRSFQ